MDALKVASAVGGLAAGLAPRIVNAYSPLITQAQRISTANTATSASMAADQRQWTAEQVAKANAYNSAEAAKSRQWQEYMSNTAHQREVADLKAAGLNPVLSAMGGNGAYVGSGATASAVMGSGASGQPDTSANNAIASILGSVLSAQTTLQSQQINAETQRAVADRYTAMERIVAEIGAAAAMRNTDVSAAASRYGAEQSSAATRYAAGLSSAAARYAAEQSAAASRYGSEQSAAASRYGSDTSARNSVRSSSAIRYASDTSATASGYAADTHKEAAVDSALISSISNILSNVLSSFPSSPVNPIGFR